eukprot:TRINITY_DN7131_c0_g1_i1.p1 TRINITY_DN7131_c0_g1~~TRINITY_DN7131_c0_g1_i1.p1  ORF type:complete len:597 (-),score=105.50 TRINITY_DN7131_c0_g1_i1:610-2145(-)
MAAPMAAPHENQLIKAGEIITFEDRYDQSFPVHVGPRIRLGSGDKADIYLGNVITPLGVKHVVLKACGRLTPGRHLSQAEKRAIEQECMIGLDVVSLSSALGFLGVSYDHPAYFCIACIDEKEPLDSLAAYVTDEDSIPLLFHVTYGRLRCVRDLLGMHSYKNGRSEILFWADGSLSNSMVDLIGDKVIKATDFGSSDYIPPNGSSERPVVFTPGYAAPEMKFASMLISDEFAAVIGALYFVKNHGKSIPDPTLRRDFVVSCLEEIKAKDLDLFEIISAAMHPIFAKPTADAAGRVDAEATLQHMDQHRQQRGYDETDVYLRRVFGKAVAAKQAAIMQSALTPLNVPLRSVHLLPADVSYILENVKRDPLVESTLDGAAVAWPPSPERSKVGKDVTGDKSDCGNEDSSDEIEVERGSKKRSGDFSGNIRSKTRKLANGNRVAVSGEEGSDLSNQQQSMSDEDLNGVEESVASEETASENDQEARLQHVLKSVDQTLYDTLKTVVSTQQQAD